VTRAVVDSSVLVSALIAPRDTPPSQVLRAWARERFELVVSPQLIAEVAGVLARPKFDRYVTPEEVADFLDMLRSDAVVHPDLAVIERATRDPHDDYLVALAKAAGAVLVSSDRDVLEADIGDLEVLNAREFRQAQPAVRAGKLRMHRRLVIASADAMTGVKAWSAPPSPLSLKRSPDASSGGRDCCSSLASVRCTRAPHTWKAAASRVARLAPGRLLSFVQGSSGLLRRNAVMSPIDAGERKRGERQRYDLGSINWPTKRRRRNGTRMPRWPARKNAATTSARRS